MIGSGLTGWVSLTWCDRRLFVIGCSIIFLWGLVVSLGTKAILSLVVTKFDVMRKLLACRIGCGANLVCVVVVTSLRLVMLRVRRDRTYFLLVRLVRVIRLRRVSGRLVGSVMWQGLLSRRMVR